MSEAYSSSKELASITSALKIDEAILKSRKIMEESKALTEKNNQKKNILEEKFKGFFAMQCSSPPEYKKDSEMSKHSSEIFDTPKAANQQLKICEMQSEIMHLNNKLASQTANLQLLEVALSESKAEKFKLFEEITNLKDRHKQELAYITEIYEQKLRNTHQKIIPKELVNIETRVRDLEDKLINQVNYNSELQERIKVNDTNKELNAHKKKIFEIEDEVLRQKEMYKHMEDKLNSASNTADPEISPKLFCNTVKVKRSSKIKKLNQTGEETSGKKKKSSKSKYDDEKIKKTKKKSH